MKEIRTVDSEGCVLCHDMTQIIRGVKKGPAFKKGHIVTKEDIPVLLSMGKDHLFVWENDDSMLHENDAAEILRQISQGPCMSASEPSEGKIDLTSDVDGLFLVDSDRLKAVNALGEIIIASRHGGFPVKKGDKLAAMRVVPLVIAKDKLEKAKEAAGDDPLFQLVPLRPLSYGVVSTGNELAAGRIEDTFTDVIREKMSEYGCEMKAHVTLPDDHARITAAIEDMLAEGVEMVICTGGMSVDPDDRTPLAIKNTGADIISYGAPVLPGAMFLLAYSKDGRPVVGLPGCVMYSRRTIFDLILPYLLAGVRVTPSQLSGYGEGGLCLQCPDCTFPNCGFGK